MDIGMFKKIFDYFIVSLDLYFFVAYNMVIVVNDYLKVFFIVWMKRLIVFFKYIGLGIINIVLVDYMMCY